MKAIVKVKKSSGYSQYNGRTFQVKEMLSAIIALEMPSQLDIERMDAIDFSYSEVIIVDIDNEIQREYEKDCWGHRENNYQKLLRYCELNKISYKKPTYYCPA
jgi:hypothetical protein